MLSFYAWWYPTRWLGWGRWPRYSEFGRLATHLRFVERMSRKLARASFHGMLVYQAGLQNKQAFLFRLVDVANELFAMAATVSRAQALADTGRRRRRRRASWPTSSAAWAGAAIKALFGELWDNDDPARYRAALAILDDRHEWLERGTIGLP